MLGNIGKVIKTVCDDYDVNQCGSLGGKWNDSYHCKTYKKNKRCNVCRMKIHSVDTACQIQYVGSPTDVESVGLEADQQ